MEPKELTSVITDILLGGEHFISGIHNSSASPTSLLTAVFQWSMSLKRDLGEVIAVVEPCIRQSILMSLLPAQALDPSYVGSIDRAIDDHLRELRINVTEEEKRIIRNICINVRRLQGMTSREARDRTATLADVKGDPRLYQEIFDRQNGRCIWCGVDLLDSNVRESLEHVIPKHLGDDPPDGSNWGLACSSCNFGKADTLAWASRPEAHDYFHRTDFTSLDEITLSHRWSVLMRSRKCISCSNPPKDKELWVYRRVRTGLAIPANCAATCLDCAKINNYEVLTPRWNVNETGRGKPIF